MQRRQAGFTLVEIAIVLVIIGLLLGGVLKGQELINSAKAKAIITDFRNTATMIAAYQDRFRALPGDDNAVDKHLSSATKATTGGTPGNGLIEGDWDSKTETDESLLMWQHLRLANLASGSTDKFTADSGWEPTNSEGGRIGVQGKSPVESLTGRLFICQGNVSGRIALQVDTTMDDGNPSQGSVQFGTWTGGKLATVKTGSEGDFKESTLYVACASF